MGMDEAEAERTVRLLLFQAVEALEQAAELLRGPLIPASPSTMRREIAVSNAIDSLSFVRKP